jgi:hypothetical protein
MLGGTSCIVLVDAATAAKGAILLPQVLEGKHDKQQFYSQELQGVDAVEAPTEVAVRYIVSDLIYPLVKNNQPHYRVRWKYYRKANEQTDEPRRCGTEMMSTGQLR